MKIKRITFDGIVESELEDGFLFEIHGYQFAFIDNKEADIRHLIELSTGHSAGTTYCFYSKKREFKDAIAALKRVAKERVDETIADARKEHNLVEPLNARI